MFKMKGLLVTIVLILTLVIASSSLALAEYKFAVSLGWLENASGQRHKEGYDKAFKKLFGNDVDVTYTDANYDPKKQSEQIEAFVEMNPDALFITPSAPAAIAPAVIKAIEAGIPTFVSDAIVPGAAATSSICSSSFSMGIYTGRYIAEKLDGKGQIGVIDLPSNENWDMRYRGLQWLLTQYPDIDVVSKWSWDSTGQVTPRQAVDNMLTAHPEEGSIDAIWCAWDGAAMEGALAVKSAGRGDEIFLTGIDGGKAAFEYIKAGTPFELTMAQSIYAQSYMAVHYANKYIQGKRVPRYVMAPVYAVTQEDLQNIKNAERYDVPGVAVEEFGWERDL